MYALRSLTLLLAATIVLALALPAGAADVDRYLPSDTEAVQTFKSGYPNIAFTIFKEICNVIA